MRYSLWAVLFCAFGVPIQASESNALAISVNIQARHIPFGTILDPVYSSPTSDRIIGYTRCGDSALWTGAFLAAESFRYRVTRSADALANARTALAGLKALADVTGDNRLARCMVPATSPFAAGIASEEAHNTIYQNPPWIWVGNISRDQIVGAFFGLGVAYDMVDDDAVRDGVSDLATRLIGYISRHQWSPNDDITSNFGLRPEALQMLLEVARHVNPAIKVSGPFLMLPVNTGVSFDVQSNSSYYKFNLDYMSLYHLVRLQDNDENRSAYGTLRRYTASHQNAFFNLIDRALRGADAVRDAESRTLLDQWLRRPRRDPYVDLSKVVQVCGSEACLPAPVASRPPTDFLWQRNPFQLAGGGSGVIEGAGIDYILPYWMARYYGVIPNPVQSAAAPSLAVAPDSLASVFGAALAPGTAQAVSQPLPVLLDATTVMVTDVTGTQRIAPLLFVSPGQVNFVVPNGTAAGAARFVVSNGSGFQTFNALVAAVAPTLFSMNGSGNGVAAATAIMTQTANPQLQSPVPVFRCGASGCTAAPINVAPDNLVYVTFYGTGIRNRSSLANVTAVIGGITVPVLYAGPTPGFAGLDQINVALTLGLRGKGDVSAVVTVDGQTSNAVTISVK